MDQLHLKQKNWLESALETISFYIISKSFTKFLFQLIHDAV